MTTREFRSIALSFPEVEEKSHFDHPDFRVSGKVFATLGFPKKGWGMASLTRKHQKSLLDSDPKAYVSANGKWGQAGATLIHLRFANKTVVRKALAAAWRYRAPSRLKLEIAVQ